MTKNLEANEKEKWERKRIYGTADAIAAVCGINILNVGEELQAKRQQQLDVFEIHSERYEHDVGKFYQFIETQSSELRDKLSRVGVPQDYLEAAIDELMALGPSCATPTVAATQSNTSHLISPSTTSLTGYRDASTQSSESHALQLLSHGHDRHGARPTPEVEHVSMSTPADLPRYTAKSQARNATTIFSRGYSHDNESILPQNSLAGPPLKSAEFRRDRTPSTDRPLTRQYWLERTIQSNQLADTDSPFVNSVYPDIISVICCPGGCTEWQNGNNPFERQLALEHFILFHFGVFHGQNPTETIIYENYSVRGEIGFSYFVDAPNSIQWLASLCPIEFTDVQSIEVRIREDIGLHDGVLHLYTQTSPSLNFEGRWVIRSNKILVARLDSYTLTLTTSFPPRTHPTASRKQQARSALAVI